MSIADLLRPELDQEFAVTRRVLARVPDDRGEWKPHPKSFPMAHLAQLVARIPGWLPMMLDRAELDIQPLDGPKFPGYSIETTATLLAEFDRNVAQAMAALARAGDAAWDEPWTLKRAGQQAATGTRYLMTRTMVVNHLVHHRAQLGLYLRLVDERVPSGRTSTADDKG